MSDRLSDADVAAIVERRARNYLLLPSGFLSTDFLVDIDKLVADRAALLADNISLMQQRAEAAEAERDHWHSHYDAALANWNDVLTERDALRARVQALEALADLTVRVQALERRLKDLDAAHYEGR